MYSRMSPFRLAAADESKSQKGLNKLLHDDNSLRLIIKCKEFGVKKLTHKNLFKMRGPTACLYSNNFLLIKIKQCEIKNAKAKDVTSREINGILYMRTKLCSAAFHVRLCTYILRKLLRGSSYTESLTADSSMSEV